MQSHPFYHDHKEILKRRAECQYGILSRCQLERERERGGVQQPTGKRRKHCLKGDPQAHRHPKYTLGSSDGWRHSQSRNV